MQQELDREKTQLVLTDMQRPYFVEYHFDDIDTYEAVANYGALTLEAANRQRLVRVICSYRQLHRGQQHRPRETAPFSPRSEGQQPARPPPRSSGSPPMRPTRTPSAPTPPSKLISSASRAAPRRLTSRLPSPSPTSSRSSLFTLDRDAWKKNIVLEASGLFASDPSVRSFAADVQYSTANVRAIAVNRYVVNTEGTVVRQGYSHYNTAISVGGQAADGMRLGRDNGSVAVDAKELESSAAFRKRVLDDLKSFNDLRNAPVASADDYHGPVLFSGDAAADVFNRLFIPNIEADRPRNGHHRPHPGRLYLIAPRLRPAGLPQRHRRSHAQDLQRQAARRLLRDR